MAGSRCVEKRAHSSWLALGRFTLRRAGHSSGVTVTQKWKAETWALPAHFGLLIMQTGRRIPCRLPEHRTTSILRRKQRESSWGRCKSVSYSSFWFDSILSSHMSVTPAQVNDGQLVPLRVSILGRLVPAFSYAIPAPAAEWLSLSRRALSWLHQVRLTERFWRLLVLSQLLVQMLQRQLELRAITRILRCLQTADSLRPR